MQDMAVLMEHRELLRSLHPGTPSPHHLPQQQDLSCSIPSPPCVSAGAAPMPPVLSCQSKSRLHFAGKNAVFILSQCPSLHVLP